MYKSLDALCEKLNISLKFNEDMSIHNSFKIGGNADRFIEINTEEQLFSVMKIIEKEKIPHFIIGNGSNLLISDKGLPMAVLKLGGDFKKIELIDENTIACGSAVMLSQLCNFAKDNNLSGLEFAFGIPGTCGGAAYMNAGAYGGEMKDVLVKCEHYNNGKLGFFENDELGLSYRESAYTNKDYIITKLVLRLEKAEQEEIIFKMNKNMSARKEKQPLEWPSAGSTFKRPVGYFAAALIDECGLKGYSVGDAQVSEKHSGFVINKGNATCKDVLELTKQIKEKVFNEKSVEIELEVKLIGEM